MANGEPVMGTWAGVKFICRCVQLLQGYLQRHRDDATEVRRHYEAGDLGELARLAHSLAGNAEPSTCL